MAHKLRRLIALLLLSAGFAYVAHAQVSPYNTVACTASTCCQIPMPQVTQPVPGGTPTTVNGPAPIVFGFHVSNAGGASAFVQFFNQTATPAAATTPVGASSWLVTSGQDRDMGTGDMGWAFTNGAQVCCSSTQGTFTAVGSCGFLLQWR